MSEQESTRGRGWLVAALIVSAAFLGGRLMIARALDRTAAQIEIAAEALAERPVAGARGRGERRGRPARPAAGQEYDVSVGEAPVLGNPNAPVTIVEFSDFQCPFCKRADPTLRKIREEYGDRVRIAFKHMPLSIHPQAPAAHAAAEAAHRQGRFWEMHDKIFENQRDLKPATFERYARELGLDVERFKRDASSKEVQARIDEDLRQAQQLSVTGTPSFFINGRFLSGAQPFVNFKALIDSELEKRS